MNVPYPSRQIRSWLVQAILSNRLPKSYDETRELRESAHLGANSHGQARVAQRELSPAG